ncbi:MAG: hypothetical protein AAFR68_21400, partial [Pseudomonadota bacterium]
ADVAKGRRQAAEKLKRIHAWQNRLDEKRCRTYRDSDTRDYRERRDRWDMGKLKPPILGTVIQSRYDVEESRNTRQAIEDRRKLNKPLEMKPISRVEPKLAPEPNLPTEPTRQGVPYVQRDPKRHAEDVAKRAQARAAERGSRDRSRKTGRKRRPRPR